MNAPFAPLPAAWRIVNHFPTPALAPDATGTVYERMGDRLRVIVTDARHERGVLRIVTASRPGGPLKPAHERVVKELFLKPDVPVKMEMPMALRHVWGRSQVIEGTVAEGDRFHLPTNPPLLDALMDAPTEKGMLVEVPSRNERVVFFVTDHHDWWRYAFVRGVDTDHPTTTVSTYEWPERWLALGVMVSHYESEHRPAEAKHFREAMMPNGRPIPIAAPDVLAVN